MCVPLTLWRHRLAIALATAALVGFPLLQTSATLAQDTSPEPLVAGDVTFFVPIVLRSAGVSPSFFSSELTLTNKGTTAVGVELAYTAAFGGGSGTGADTLEAGRQKIVPDAIAYLRSRGVPIPQEDPCGGTLRVRFSGLSSVGDAFVSVRTTTVVPEGRAGLAYAGAEPSTLPASLPGDVPPIPPAGTSLASGTYRPTNYGSGDTFPSPAPSPVSGTSLTVFNGTNPNGTWNLFVVDDTSGDSGRIANGWCLDVDTSDGSAKEVCSDALITIPSIGAASPYPSAIAVSGLTGTVTHVAVTLRSLSHSCAPDLDILLAGPAGQSLVLMSDGGRCNEASTWTLTFDEVPSAPDTVICGLRQNATDRSNVAVAHAGVPGDGDIVLRVTVVSGDPANPGSMTLPDETLSPGGFKQFNGILGALSNGYVRVQKVAGGAPYYAYGVVNDQGNSDGSFVSAQQEGANAGKRGLILPVVVETGVFSSELVVTNFSGERKELSLEYVSDGLQTLTGSATFNLSVGPREQQIIPGFVQFLRDRGVTGVGPAGSSYAGALFATVSTGDVKGLFLGARTSAPGGGGRYGLFYAAIPAGGGLGFQTAWFHGLQQNVENRSNLAIVNTGESDASTDTFKIEVFDGNTGALAGTEEGITIAPKKWAQIGGVITRVAPAVQNGYARLTRTAGTNPYLTYAVINDGGAAGQRSGDGAFVSATPGSAPLNSSYAGSWSGTTNEGLAGSFTVAGAQVTAFTMNLRVSHPGLSCPTTFVLETPADITGNTAAVKAKTTSGVVLSGQTVSLVFTSATTATATYGALTFNGGIFCSQGFVIGGTSTNGPWTLSATKH